MVTYDTAQNVQHEHGLHHHQGAKEKVNQAYFKQTSERQCKGCFGLESY